MLEKYNFIILLNNIFNEFKNNKYSWKVNSKSLFHKIAIINILILIKTANFLKFYY